MSGNNDNQEINKINNIDDKLSTAEKVEVNKLIDLYYTSKGYIKSDGNWKNPKTGNKPQSVIKSNKQYSKVFQKFWDKQIISGKTTIYHDKTKVLNPATGRFKLKKNVKKSEGTEIFQNKILKTDDYLINNIQPQIISALESGNKTTINIETGKFGNIKKLLE